jgi:3-oxoacyl-[acyl-carrier-protein] synthase-3
VTALDAVASYLPAHRVPIADLRDQLGLSRAELKVFQRYYGLAEIRREPAGTIADLLVAAAEQLDGLRGHEHRVRYVLQARTYPVVAPHPVNPLHEVCRRLGLRHAVAFAVTQHACASGLLAVDIAGRLLAADGDPDARALVLTGEKTFTRGARLIPRTAVMGEGAAACLVRAGGDRDRLLAYAVAMHGQYDDADRSADLAVEFQQRYAGLLAEVMLTALDRAGLQLADLALVLPHNVNAISWDRLCRTVDLPIERVLLDNVPVTGHCFCADGFINYRTAVQRDLLRPGDHYLMAAVGLGATFSAMVFRH